jgi:hypothetical protein
LRGARTLMRKSERSLFLRFLGVNETYPLCDGML